MSIRSCLAGCVALFTLAAPAGAAPGNGKLAYARAGAAFVAASDGSGETQIADGVYTARPLWAPDGSHVAYLRQIYTPSGYDDIVPVAAAPDGSGVLQLAARGQFALACWLDATTLVARRIEPAETGPYLVSNDLYAFELGGATRRLTDDGGLKDVSPQGCAPDGSAVAYSKQQPDFKWKAFVVRVDGGAARQLTPPGFSDSAPAWSPIGDKLAFARGGVGAGLYVSGTDGGAAARVTPLTAQGIRWSPDATQLLYTYPYIDYSRCSRYGCATAYEVRLVAADGSRESELTDGNAGDGQGWSPDGTRIVVSGGNRSFVMNVDGSCKTALPPTVPSAFDWQAVPGQLPAPALECADLAVSTDVHFVDLPLSATTAYKITVMNQGNERASAVALDQPAVEGIDLVGAQPSRGTCHRDAELHCDLGSLGVGASADVTVSVHLKGITRGNVSPRASAPEPDGNPFDNTTTVGFTVLDCTILGTYGADELYGSPRRDRICGRSGNDTIYGNEGNDFIDAGEGADTVYGGKGHDVILGRGGNDAILARDGERDVIDCGPEKDTVVADRIDVVSNCRTVYLPRRVAKHKHRPRR